MIVDNHEESLYLTMSILEGCNAEILPTTSAKQALAALETFQPDLLISELRLPEEDGYALVRKVKAYADRHNLYIPAISLTSQISQAAEDRALSAGFHEYIAKPYDMETLIETVAQLVETVAQLVGTNSRRFKHCSYRTTHLQ